MSEKFEQIVNTEPEIIKPKLEKRKYGPLGISVSMAEDRGRSVNPENFKNDFKSETISLMEQDLAMAFREDEPILFEGGTGIGKSRTVERVCAELGYEVYKLPCSSSTTEREMMGRYISNPNKKTDMDPEVIFSLGVIAKALVDEPNKIKVIYLDELNTIDPQVGTRLHAILDVIKNGFTTGEVELVEDAGEILKFDPKRVKVIATINPANSENLHAQKLSSALLRRFTQKKMPDALPDEEFRLFSVDMFQKDEVLKFLPGIADNAELVKAYAEFHKGIQGLVKNKTIAEGLSQKPAYEDIDYLKRVIKKVGHFWEDGLFKGDLPTIFQEAVKYIYTGMLINEDDKKAVQNLINTLDFKPSDDTNRQGLEARAAKKAKEEKERLEREKKEAEEKARLGSEGAKEKAEADKVIAKTDEEVRALKASLRKAKKEVLGESFEPVITAKYKYKDEKGKETVENIEIDFEKKLVQTLKFYKEHGIAMPADFAEQMKDVWEENRDEMQKQIEEFGFDEVLIIPANLKLTDAFDKELTKNYKKKDGSVGEPTYWGEKKEDIVSDSRSSKDRIILVHKNKARDLKEATGILPILRETLGKKGGEFKPEEGMTIEEYFVFQRAYFEETGEHLDGGEGITWLPGSRVGSRVVHADFNPDFGRVSVLAGGPDFSFPHIGCRPSRCFFKK